MADDDELAGDGRHAELGSRSVAIRVRRAPAVLEVVDGEREEREA